MPRRRSLADIQAVLDLKASAATDRETSAATGVPISTIRCWRNHGLPGRTKKPPSPFPACPACGLDLHEFQALPHNAYAYLLGVYLGDGHVVRNGGSWTLRIVLDAVYPGIIRECCDAIEAGRGVAPPLPRSDKRSRCVRIGSTWKAWPCLFPQHGPGRKHDRSIALERWQGAIVEASPGSFLRGLIQTDGWRGVNRVHAKGKDYEYPRYQFSNRSDDIRNLFTDTCDLLGIKWRQWTRYHVSVAQAESVALLDTYVGVKA